MNNRKIFIGLIILFAIVLSVGFGYYLAQNEASEGSTSSQVSLPPEDVVVVKGDATKDTTEAQLLYLIEEEKLAHDVYSKMYELWGARVFGNILQSESTHQSQVLGLLQTRGIADPRSTEIGVFTNKELQALYTSLIKKGNLSTKNAYEVGVIIEEKDIKDINTQLKTAVDDDVVTTLESLRRGSENHLRAFNRQL